MVVSWWRVHGRWNTWSVRWQLRSLVIVLCSLMFLTAGITFAAIHTESDVIDEQTTIIGPARDLNTSILQRVSDSNAEMRDRLDGVDTTFPQEIAAAERTVTSVQRELRSVLADQRLADSTRTRYSVLESAQDSAVTSWFHFAGTATPPHSPAQVAADLKVAATLFNRVRSTNDGVEAELETGRAALRSRVSHLLGDITFVVFGVAAIATAAAFVLARQASSSLTDPIARLQQVVRRQREGDVPARADEHDGAAEVRDLAGAFNVLTNRNGELARAQAEALRLQQVVLDVETILRKASGLEETVQGLCDALGPALSADRVVVDSVYCGGKVIRRAQWHSPGLVGLSDLSDGLSRHLGQLVDQLWRTSGRLLVEDLKNVDTFQWPWIPLFRDETGARSLIMVPVGLGMRVIGTIKVLTEKPRSWTSMEGAAIQQIATFLGRAINNAEVEAQQADYVGRLERLDQQKTDFLSTISHELRTPLTSINGYVELLLDGAGGEVSSAQEQMLIVVERNTVRLRGLIEDLLVLSRVESGSLRLATSDVSLGELVRHTIDELRPIITRSGVRVEVDEGTNDAVVTGDRGYLQRALVNVVSNAVKFTPYDGTVRVCCTVDATSEEIVVTCQDTGIGIPDADVEHLFTRFFRASNASNHAIPGTGLGLAIVKTIVDAHHGRLTVTSTEGVGTTMTLCFPMARTATALL